MNFEVEQYQQIAEKFSELLMAELGLATMVDICEANKHAGKGACASHDYVDANMFMADAFRSVTGRDMDICSYEDNALWSDAWNHAITEDFYIDWGDLHYKQNLPG